MIPEVEDEQSVLALVLQQGGFPEAWAQAPRQGWGGAIRDRLREWEGTGEECAGRGLQRHPCAGRRGGRWGGLRGWEGGEGGGWVTWYPGRCLPTSSVLSQPSGIGPAPPAPALRLCLCLPPAVRCLPHPWVGPCCGPGPGPQCGPARWPRPAREPPHLRRLSTWEASLVPLGKPRWFAMLPWPLGLLRGLGCPRTVCGP